ICVSLDSWSTWASAGNGSASALLCAWSAGTTSSRKQIDTDSNLQSSATVFQYVFWKGPKGHFPSPRPSPAGRGRNVIRLSPKHRVCELPETLLGCSLLLNPLTPSLSPTGGEGGRR